jgi:hypothetical protein
MTRNEVALWSIILVLLLALGHSLAFKATPPREQPHSKEGVSALGRQ